MSLRTGKFTQRNSFYLRISSTTVLQLLLLLDARHVDWMSPEILEKVLNVLRTHIATKLGAESGNTMSKKRREADSEKIDVFRGAGWQMVRCTEGLMIADTLWLNYRYQAYYFRKQVHRHAVLLKNKQITFEPFSKENPRPAPPLETRRRRKRKAIDIPDDDEEEEQNTSGATEDVPQVKEEEDLDTQPLFRPDFDDDEDEDEKPEGKPKLRVSYDGFSIFGKLLVVIVEPYPPLRGQSRASVRPDERELSVAPSVRGTREESEFAVPQAPGRQGSRQRSESSTPLRSAANPLFRPETPVPDSEEEEGLDGFRARSQSILGYNPSEDEREEEAGGRWNK